MILRMSARPESSPEFQPRREAEPAVVIFDGRCGFCQRSVRFILRRDTRRHFVFAPRQSEIGQRLLREAGFADAQPNSMVLIEGGRSFVRSTASLRIVRRLGGVWRLLYALVVIPRPVRDAVYGLIALNRHRLSACRVEDRAAFRGFEDRFLA